MLAASIWPAMPGIFSNHSTYKARTEPAVVANPPVMIAISSEFDISLIKGLTIMGASV